MNLEEAKKFLSDATRWELRDHAFGDTEFGWTKDGEDVATGYSGGGNCSLSIKQGEEWASFEGAEARELRECGTLGEVSRNDETGPEVYTEGDVMPGLSLGDVFHELTGTYLDGS